MNKVFHTRVYPITALVGGKKVVVNHRGYFTLVQSGPRVWKALGTPSREIAQKRIMEMALQAQRVQEGMSAPDSQRETAAKPVSVLVTEYEKYLLSQGCAKKHAHDTTTRLSRMAKEIGWRAVNDVRPDTFQSWQTTLTCSQKTKKEYQVSACAFLNWLVSTERLAKNPLAKLDKPDTKGKQVRQSRYYTQKEFAQLLGVAAQYALGYQFLLYTGCRWSEAYAVVWGDLNLEGESPYVLLREGTTKNDNSRRVDLKAELVELLKAARDANASPTDRALKGRLACYDLFRKHLTRAGIEHKNALGLVIHLHSLRKTFQTWGADHGVNQRAAQDVLGHSDANLTAKVYTDRAGLGMKAEMAKLPWVTAAGTNAQPDAQKCGKPSHPVSLNDIVAQLVAAVRAAGSEQLSHLMSLRDISGHTGKLGAGAGFEPATFRL
ncbi:Integrase [Opitutus sp. GAS368]|nr:Integrase [Opitutus sp. GAS368]